MNQAKSAHRRSGRLANEGLIPWSTPYFVEPWTSNAGGGGKGALKFIACGCASQGCGRPEHRACGLSEWSYVGNGSDCFDDVKISDQRKGRDNMGVFLANDNVSARFTARSSAYLLGRCGGRGLKILVIDRHMAKQAITGFKDALPILLMTLSGVWMSVS